MQVTINLPPDLEQALINQAAQSNVSLQIVILQTLRLMSQKPPVDSPQWPEAVLSYEGIPDFPAFESYRNELLLPTEPEIF